MPDTTVIQVQDLHKAYGSVVAVDQISFEVAEGEIFCMVGPNGAGKTTTVECIEGLTQPSSGHIRVLGLDPHKERYSLCKRIGIQLQESSLQDRIKVWEALDLYASFYSQPLDWQILLEKVGLAEKRHTRFAKLSGGQKQRLFIALAMVNDPELIFLDELTTGLDPQARRTMWEMVREIRGRGKTVFLITHSMEEAERLSDRVAIVDQGRILALDSPENLIRTFGTERRVVFTTGDTSALEHLGALPEVSRVDRVGEQVIVFGNGETLLTSVVNTLSSKGYHLHDVQIEQPTLEDVFLKLTGRAMRD